jgi:hypothetical protein
MGITRAMDNVNVFTVESKDPILMDLAACFQDGAFSPEARLTTRRE